MSNSRLKREYLLSTSGHATDALQRLYLTEPNVEGCGARLMLGWRGREQGLSSIRHWGGWRLLWNTVCLARQVGGMSWAYARDGLSMVPCGWLHAGMQATMGQYCVWFYIGTEFHSKFNNEHIYVCRCLYAYFEIGWEGGSWCRWDEDVSIVFPDLV